EDRVGDAYVGNDEVSLDVADANDCVDIDGSQTHAVSQASRVFGGERMVANEPVPGLRAALREVGLAAHACAAEAWCQERGAAFISELLAHFGDLSVALGHAEGQGV
ncbi:unnamed protein product, partial [Prorocentrum cordatum]